MVQSPSEDRNPSLSGWAEPPWTCQSPEWLAIDADLSPAHLARDMAQLVELLDLLPLYETYSGRGSLPHRPDLLLKVVLYDLQRGRHRPVQWAADFLDSRSVRWLALGMRVSRSCCYAFRDRLGPLLDQWHQEVLQQALEMGLSEATRSALDGSSVAAQASRHKLLNSATVEKRLATLEAVRASEGAVTEAAPLAAPVASAPGELDGAPQRPIGTATVPESAGATPSWLAPTARGRQLQYQRYQKSQVELERRHLQNQQRPADKRRAPEKVVLSPGDSEAPLGLDKEKVYRPLYNVQVSRDLDSALILAYEVFAQPTDAATLGPMLERQLLLTGRLPQQQLTDAGYATALDLAECARLGVELYAPYQENDFSASRKTSEPKQLPKSAFRWLETEQMYHCPQGHPLQPASRERQRRAGGQRLEVVTYRCAASFCMACEQQAECTKNPQAGRTVKRSEYEHLVEALHIRMATAQAKALYKLRKQTVELGFADMKAHRELRRFSGKGLRRARTEVGLLTLAHNGLTLVHALETVKEEEQKGLIPQKLAA